MVISGGLAHESVARYEQVSVQQIVDKTVFSIDAT